MPLGKKAYTIRNSGVKMVRLIIPLFFKLVSNIRDGGDRSVINEKKNLDSSGFSLVSAIVTLAVCSAGMAYITEKSSIGLRNHTNIQTELDRFVITRQLQTSADCVKSFDPAATCTSGGNKKLFDQNNNVIVSDTGAGTKMGSFTVKAECNAANDGLIIKAARLSSTGTLTSTVLRFSPNDTPRLILNGTKWPTKMPPSWRPKMLIFVHA